jgi:hypothetical protein
MTLIVIGLVSIVLAWTALPDSDCLLSLAISYLSVAGILMGIALLMTTGCTP